MDEKIIVLVGTLVIFGIASIVGIYFKIQDFQLDNNLDKQIAKMDYNLIKCNEAFKNVGMSTEEASSAINELAKALDSPIITVNEARKRIGYEPISNNYTIDYTGRYRCPACGTMYIHEGGGFIPNCKNCGSQLVEQMMIKKETENE